MPKKSYKRELIEWTIIIVIGLTLYLTGMHTQVIGYLQRGILATGIITPDVIVSSGSAKTASYNFELANMGGRSINFSEFEGETVFMNFWATWCAPCIAEMPDIQNLYDEKGESVKFVMISVDEEPDKAKRFIERKGFDFPVYFLKSSLPNTYDPRSIPTTYVLSPEGKIVLNQRGMAKYNTDGFKEFLDGLNE